MPEAAMELKDSSCFFAESIDPSYIFWNIFPSICRRLWSCTEVHRSLFKTEKAVKMALAAHMVPVFLMQITDFFLERLSFVAFNLPVPFEIRNDWTSISSSSRGTSLYSTHLAISSRERKNVFIYHHSNYHLVQEVESFLWSPEKTPNGFPESSVDFQFPIPQKESRIYLCFSGELSLLLPTCRELDFVVSRGLQVFIHTAAVPEEAAILKEGRPEEEILLEIDILPSCFR